MVTLPDTWPPPRPPAAVLAGPASCRPARHRAEGRLRSALSPEPWAGLLTCTSGPLAFMLVVMWLLPGRRPQAACPVVRAPDGVWLCCCHCPGLRLPGLTWPPCGAGGCRSCVVKARGRRAHLSRGPSASPCLRVVRVGGVLVWWSLGNPRSRKRSPGHGGGGSASASSCREARQGLSGR